MMDEDSSNSWLRRTKFSHTVCHRLDYSSSRLGSFSIQPRTHHSSGLKSRPDVTFVSETSSQVRKKSIMSKQRSLSPLPETSLSETFKEARHEWKRFSTPGPRRKEHDKRIMGKLLNKDSHVSSSKSPYSSPMTKSPYNSPMTKSPYSSPIRHLASMKLSDKSKQRKDSGWTRYFDHGGGKVTAVETAEEWNVDLSKLFVGVRFAHGAHSRLYHGMYKDEAVAVKIIRVPDDDENGMLADRLEKQFIREVSLLSRLHHRNIIKFVAACRKPPVYCVITEYLSEGSLRSYLHKLETKTIPLQKLITFALDIARGMEYIHSQGVIHRDLKPENVLISEDFHLKIADFGIACEEAYCDLFADDPGTYRWMAPEMIKRKSYGRKVDVYSFGLILWEMVTGTIPYEDMTPIQAAFAVVNKNSRPVIPSDCPAAMRALIEQCWSLNPDKRPEFWQVVKVLEQFESSLARDGTLTLVQNLCCQDHKKGLLHWIQKLGPVHQNNGPVPKPKFT
ncbi:serine/threonine-protein kinase HT1-like [Vigna unguiculata]|nr:serine/threonine-protein kinase HT1-like [Vigna unguiculata]XP_027918845.1 serine/threonine-protein kinase HT1-like [Vigna unguiculata]XP_027918846.1 serine/threonine-protein kinase HT1-like [Vigna unguiculata]